MKRSLTLYHFLAARWRWARLRGERLTQFQDRRAQALVNWTRKHSAFYRAHWGAAADWADLPTVGKQLMMDNFDSFNTLGVAREAALQAAIAAEQSRDFKPQIAGATVGLSSGTSGHRGLFLVSAAEQAMWAGVILSRVLHHLSPRRLRVAFFLRSNSNLYEEINSRLIQFHYFDLMMPLRAAVAQLNEYTPNIVVGPPSLLGLLAGFQQTGELRIGPERLIAVAEVLEPQDKSKLESIFGVRVDQVYQCTEGLLAISCAAGSLHLQEDVVAIQAQPLGEGRVLPVVTDLWRRAQPIIRYQLSDVLRLSGQPCGCGNPFRVVEAIEGRQDDICYFSGRPVFPDAIRRMILLASDGIEEYAATQARPSHLRVTLNARAGTNEANLLETVRASIERGLREYGCAVDQIEVGLGVEPPPPGVKRRRVRNMAVNQ